MSGFDPNAVASAAMSPFLTQDPSSPALDVSQWINQHIVQATKAAAAPEELDEALAQTVRAAAARLQTLSVETSKSTQILMEKLVSSAPRAKLELDRLSRDAAHLRLGLSRLEDRAAAAQPASQTSASQQHSSLKDLDVIKTNLTATLAYVRAAIERTTLLKEIEDLLQQRMLSKAASKLALLKSKTSTTTSEGPDKDKLERIEQRLESLLRPSLKEALQSANHEALKDSMEVFASLGRLESFLETTTSHRAKTVFEELWQEPANASWFVHQFVPMIEARLEKSERVVAETLFPEDPERRSEYLSRFARELVERVDPVRVVDLFMLLDESSEKRLTSCGEAVSAVRDLSAKFPTLARVDFARLTRNLVESYPEMEISYISSVCGLRMTGDLDEDEEEMKRLVEGCAQRCRIVGASPVAPVCTLFERQAARATTRLQSATTATPAGEEEEEKTAPNNSKLETIKQVWRTTHVWLYESFPFTVEPLEREEASAASRVERALEALETAASLAREALFDALVRPAYALLDQAMAEAARGGEANSSKGPRPSGGVAPAMDYVMKLVTRLPGEILSESRASARATMAQRTLQLGRRERAEIARLMPIALAPLETWRQEEEEESQRVVGEMGVASSWLTTLVRALGTRFALKVVRDPIPAAQAPQLGSLAEFLERSIGSMLAQEDRWDLLLGAAKLTLKNVEQTADLWDRMLTNPMYDCKEARRALVEAYAQTLRERVVVKPL